MTTTYIVTEAFAASVLEIKNPWFIVGKDGGPVILGVFAGRAAARAANAPPNGLAGKIVSLNEITLKTVTADRRETPAEIVLPVDKIPEVNLVIKVPVAVVKEPNLKSTIASIKPPKNTSGKHNRSNVEKPVTICWNLFDEMKGGRRKDSIAAAVAKGVTFYTAHSQYQLWFQIQKEMKAREEASAAAKVKK